MMDTIKLNLLEGFNMADQTHQVTLRGRVHRVNTRFSKNDLQMNTFDLSVYAGKNQSEEYNPSMWIHCLNFGDNPPAEKSEIVCAGKLDYDQWTDKNTGEQRGKHKLIVNAWHPHVREQQQGYGAQQHPPTSSYQNQQNVPF